MRRRLILMACSAALSCSGFAYAQSSPNAGEPSPNSSSTPAAPGSEAERLTREDFTYLATVSILFDIEIAELAAAKAVDPSVRAFAGRVIADRRAALQDLRHAAGETPTPAALDDENRRVVDALAAEEGAEFDVNFVGMMIDANQDAIDLYEEFAETSNGGALAAYVAARQDSLRSLLDEARQLESGLPPGDVGAR